MDGRNEGPQTTTDKPKMVIATNSENNAEFVRNPEFGKDANIKIVRIDLPKTLTYDTKETQWGANPNYVSEDFNPNYIVIAVDLNRNSGSRYLAEQIEFPQSDPQKQKQRIDELTDTQLAQEREEIETASKYAKFMSQRFPNAQVGFLVNDPANDRQKDLVATLKKENPAATLEIIPLTNDLSKVPLNNIYLARIQNQIRLMPALYNELDSGPSLFNKSKEVKTFSAALEKNADNLVGLANILERKYSELTKNKKNAVTLFNDKSKSSDHHFARIIGLMLKDIYQSNYPNPMIFPEVLTLKEPPGYEKAREKVLGDSRPPKRHTI